LKVDENGLSNESLDDIHQTLETHPSGDIHEVLFDLFQLFQNEKEHHLPNNLTINDPIYCFFKKIEGKADA